MKRLRYNIMVWSIATMVILFAGAGCQSPNLRRVNWYPYYEASIDDIPPLEDIVGIAYTGRHPDLGSVPFLIGDRELVEHVLGHEIDVRKVLNDWKWIKTITLDLKEAKRVKNDDKNFGHSKSCLTFFTRKGGFMVLFDDSDTESIVQGPGYQSELLSSDLWELNSLLYPPKPTPKVPNDPNDFFNVPNSYEGF